MPESPTRHFRLDCDLLAVRRHRSSWSSSSRARPLGLPAEPEAKRLCSGLQPRPRTLQRRSPGGSLDEFHQESISASMLRITRHARRETRRRALVIAARTESRGRCTSEADDRRARSPRGLRLPGARGVEPDEGIEESPRATRPESAARCRGPRAPGPARDRNGPRYAPLCGVVDGVGQQVAHHDSKVLGVRREARPRPAPRCRRSSCARRRAPRAHRKQPSTRPRNENRLHVDRNLPRAQARQPTTGSRSAPASARRRRGPRPAPRNTRDPSARAPA